MKYRVTEKGKNDEYYTTYHIMCQDENTLTEFERHLAKEAGMIKEIKDPLEECKRSFYALAHQLGLDVFYYESLWNIVERDWKSREKELFTIDEVLKAIKKRKESKGYADLIGVEYELKNSKK